MIKEDYVSFETAKLLKEKGFDVPCYRHYDNKGDICGKYVDPDIPFNYSSVEYYLCPSQSMAMRWLREVHNIFIEIMVGESEGKTWYDYDILPVNGKFIYWKGVDVQPPTIECNTPEEAIEIGLKYCLENLI